MAGAVRYPREGGVCHPRGRTTGFLAVLLMTLGLTSAPSATAGIVVVMAGGVRLVRA